MQRNVDCLEQREGWSEENEKLLHKVIKTELKRLIKLAAVTGVSVCFTPF
jgi:hypothetical protein